MRPFLNKTRSLSLTALVLMAMLACSKNETNPVTVTDLALQPTALGKVLADDQGKTLYFFAGDVDGKANCTGGCLTNWPAYYKEAPTLGGDLAAARFHDHHAGRRHETNGL